LNYFEDELDCEYWIYYQQYYKRNLDDDQRKDVIAFMKRNKVKALGRLEGSKNKSKVENVATSDYNKTFTLGLELFLKIIENCFKLNNTGTTMKFVEVKRKNNIIVGYHPLFSGSFGTGIDANKFCKWFCI
jgi:hypothetical protein